MATRPNNLIEALQRSIGENHACTAVYLRSVYVEEVSDGQALWTGQVEIFEIKGHLQAKTAYGWWEEKAETELITILALTPTLDARKAVQAFLMSQNKP